MTDNPYRVHAIHYADGEVEDLDAMRESYDQAVSLSYWLANELGEHIDHQTDETQIDTVKRYADERCAVIEAERDDLARRVMEAADALSVGLPGGALVGGRGLVIAVRHLAEDRDRWKSDCEKARARWTSPWSHRERWVGESAEPIPFPRPYNDLHQIQVDYQRTIHCGTGGPSPAERQETYQKVFEAAMSLVYEVTHLRAQVTDLQAELADERVVDAVVIDHTDPDQIRRAAGVIEGIAMDRGATHPEDYWTSPATLRRRAELAAVERWRPLVTKALTRNGFTPGRCNQDRVLAQIRKNSGGDPDFEVKPPAAVRFQASMTMVGLLPMSPELFRQYRDLDLVDDPRDPEANLNASLRWSKAHYGDNLAAAWP